MFYAILSAQKIFHPKLFWVKQGATQCYQAFLVFCWLLGGWCTTNEPLSVFSWKKKHNKSTNKDSIQIWTACEKLFKIEWSSKKVQVREAIWRAPRFCDPLTLDTEIRIHCTSTLLSVFYECCSIKTCTFTNVFLSFLAKQQNWTTWNLNGGRPKNRQFSEFLDGKNTHQLSMFLCFISQEKPRAKTHTVFLSGWTVAVSASEIYRERNSAKNRTEDAAQYWHVSAQWEENPGEENGNQIMNVAEERRHEEHKCKLEFLCISHLRGESFSTVRRTWKEYSRVQSVYGCPLSPPDAGLQCVVARETYLLSRFCEAA